MAVTVSGRIKLNLGLRIVGRRSDGYHRLHTLFQGVDYGDTITLTEDAGGDILLVASGPGAEDLPENPNDNLCIKAAQLLRSAAGAGQGVHISLEKLVPVGTGLGGGSADAAAVLRGLNRLWKLGLSGDELEELAVQLGADVPFFIRGGLQLGEGIGEILTPIQRILYLTAVIVIPPFSVNTSWAYAQMSSRTLDESEIAFDSLIMREDIPWDMFVNDLEPVVFPHYPRLAEMKAGLLELGALHAGMSGSGSAVFGLFADPPTNYDIFRTCHGCQVISGRFTTGSD